MQRMSLWFVAFVSEVLRCESIGRWSCDLQGPGYGECKNRNYDKLLARNETNKTFELQDEDKPKTLECEVYWATFSGT